MFNSINHPAKGRANKGRVMAGSHRYALDRHAVSPTLSSSLIVSDEARNQIMSNSTISIIAASCSRPSLRVAFWFQNPGAWTANSFEVEGITVCWLTCGDWERTTFSSKERIQIYRRYDALWTASEGVYRQAALTAGARDNPGMTVELAFKEELANKIDEIRI